MRSPFGMVNLYGPAKASPKNSAEATNVSNGGAHIPKVKSSPVASLSSFAAPSWGNNIGERNSNVRVVARIRPTDMDCGYSGMKSINENGDGDGNTRVVFAINQEGNDCGDLHNHASFSSPLKSPMSEVSVSSSTLGSTSTSASTSVTSLAAKFNSPTSKPLVPDASTIKTTPTKTRLFSPTKFKTPVHANRANSSGVESSPSMRPNFIQPPSPVQSGYYSGASDTESIENSTRSKNIPQTIVAGDHNVDVDAVIDTSATQDLLYRSAVGNAIRMNIFRGFNTCIIAYGQRGSGKTYTMYGPKKKMRTVGNVSRFSDDASIRSIDSNGGCLLREEDGVVLRAINDLFMAKAKQATASEVMITMNFVEVSHDGIFDLLSSRKSVKKTAPPLVIRDNSIADSTINGMPIKGLTSIRLKDANHARLIIDAASRRRDNSSSHTICTLHVTMNPAVKSSITSGRLASMTSTDVITAKLTLVDLAGSERNRSDGISSTKEDAFIKKDIFALGQCISALAANAKDNSKKYVVPYRDSKLTRILRDSLGGNCCTVMIACIAPCKKNLDDTMSTLRLAERARCIVNRIKKNQTKTKMLTPNEAAALRRENKVLKAHVLDLMKKIQFFIGEGNKSKVVFDFGSLELPTSSSGSLHRGNDSDSSTEHNRWRLKYEKLAQLCRDANVPMDGAALNTEDENLLASHAFELNELRDQISTLQKLQLDDCVSTTSGLTAETGDFNEEASMLSLSSQSLKTCEYIDISKNIEVDEKRRELEASKFQGLMKAIKEKESQIVEVDRKRGTLKKKMELEEESFKARIGQKNQSLIELDSKLVDGEKQLERLRGEEASLKDSIEKARVELESYSMSIEEKEMKQNAIDIQALKLRAEIKSLHDEKFSLFELIEDAQNTTDLIQELSDEKEAGNELRKKLDDATSSRNDLAKELEIARRSKISEVQKRIDIEAELKQSKDRLKQLEKLVADEKKMDKPEGEEVLKQRVKHESSLPPLPSWPKKRKSKDSARDMASKKRKSTDDGGGFSSISVSGLLADFKPTADREGVPTILWPQDDEEEKVEDSNNSAFDNQSQHSSFTLGNESLSSEQRAIRLHAQKLLFWADRAVGNSMDTSQSLCPEAAENDKENNGILSTPPSTRSNSDQMKRALSPKDVCQEVKSESPSTCINTPQEKRCTCSNSMFSGNAEHAEFFLPRLGKACKCGAMDRSGLADEDPTALKAFLRTWQVSFLHSAGVYTAEDLLTRFVTDHKQLGKKMKRWRNLKKMKPARTKSCITALQIWSKTAKMVLRSNRMNERRIKRSTGGETYGDNDSASGISKRPSFMEIEVGGSRDVVDEVSIMSMEDDLYEGEVEV